MLISILDSAYRRIHVLLRREGHQANHKRVFRLYQGAGLAVPKRKRRQRVAVERHPLTLSEVPNQVWSMDFVMDALSNGRRLKCLNIVDDCTKEAVGIVVDHSITGEYVVRVLEQAALFRGLPGRSVLTRDRNSPARRSTSGRTGMVSSSN